MDFINQEKQNIKIYKKLYKRYGNSFKSLDWGSKEKQMLRFKILSKIGNLNKKKILDVGCGFADFNLWLKKNKKRVNYFGIDIVPEMIYEAKKKHKKSIFYCGSFLENKDIELQKFDYVFASGIFTFNKKKGNSILKKTVFKMWKMSEKGIAFNCLNSKNKFKNSKEFSANPNIVYNFCKKLSKNIKLDQSYLPSDFTIYLKK